MDGGTICNILKSCWNCINYFNDYIRNLERNLRSLRQARNNLYTLSEDVRRRIDLGIEHSEPRQHVQYWLTTAQQTIGEVDSLLQRGSQEEAKLCLGGYCSKNCWSSYRVGRQIVEKINDVTTLTSTGRRFDVVADLRPPPAVETMHMENIVGIDSRLSEVWTCIEDDSVRIIGLHGISGVGKSTLLQQLNNKFINTTLGFDVVILVKESTNKEKIQEVMLSRLGVPDEFWKNKSEDVKAAEIGRRLSNKKFALLLDDLRGQMNLAEAGVPTQNQNGSKIVFTTITEDVCNSMFPDWRFKVDCLTPNEAWNLFRLKVTDRLLNSHTLIEPLARTVAELCGGLPLALITIGSTMATRTSPDEWEHAVNRLKSYPSEFEGMETDVFTRLKFSYDSLRSKIHKTCFLFCSLFLKEEIIMKDELVELWIGEGLFGDYDVNVARKEGKFIIGSLIRACLLEEVEGSKNFVKVHGLLRVMALLIASQEGNKILVLEPDRSNNDKETANWEEAVRVSLRSRGFLANTPSCPRLLTLLARSMNEECPNNFFKSMHHLKVLDLSSTELTKLPLRNNELERLRYLNLFDTKISELPMEIKSCTQLRILLLDGTKNLKAIPPGLLSNLGSLQVFSRLPTAYFSDNNQPSTFGATHGLLEELESLILIQEVSLLLFTLDSVRKFKRSSKLQSCTRRIIHWNPEFLSLDVSSSTSSVTRMHQDVSFQNLQDLTIIRCDSIKDLTCLVNVPHLRCLFASHCPSLEEIIANPHAGAGPSEIEENLKMFHNLKQLNLYGLSNLNSICYRVLALPSLESIYVSDCPNLRKLPLNSETTNKNAVLLGEQDWWDDLEWNDDEATKLDLSSKFITLSDSRAIAHQPQYTYETSIMTSAFLKNYVWSSIT